MKVKKERKNRRKRERIEEGRGILKKKMKREEGYPRYNCWQLEGKEG